MKFGGQTVVFVSITEDPDIRDAYNNPLIVRTETPVTGCRFRPLTAKEKTELGYQVVSDPWKITAPPVVTAAAIDEVSVDGVTYQITGGVRTFPDVQGRPFKVTVIVERVTI